MRQVIRDTQSWLSLLAGMLLIVGVGGRAEAITLHVANNGLDNPSCGTKQDPCRSIGQAVARANAGDKIMVGPGRYGDLNGNGAFGERGEEVAEVGFGCSCMIHLNKRVTVISRDGAFTTVLDAGGALANPVRISASASGVVLGQPGHGFLITGAGGGFNGLNCCGGASDVRVAGNVASGNGGSGFATTGTGNLVNGNVARGSSNFGFAIFGSGHVLRGNVASDNVHGFAISGNGHLLRENDAIGNRVDGVFVFDGGREIQLFQNSILGNGDSGIRLALGVDATIRRNNIYGNNGCGLFNESQGLIKANNNFWGTVTGPGPLPANEFCDIGNSNTVFSPFATKEFRMTGKSFAIQGQSLTSDTD